MAYANKKYIPDEIVLRERNFLVSLIDNPKIYQTIHGRVKSEDFYSPEAQELYRIIVRAIRDKDQPIVSIKLIEDRAKELKSKLNSDLRSESYWETIKNTEPLDPSSLDKFLEELLRYSTFKSIKKDLTDSEILLELSPNHNKVAEHLTSALEKVQGYLIPDECTLDASECMRVYCEYQDKLNPDEQGVIGIKSGLPFLDVITKGFKPGELTIIGAQSSVDKSALMATMINNITTERPVGFFSLEMSLPDFIKRLISMRSRLKLETLNNKSYLKPGNERMLQRYEEAIEDYRGRRFHATEMSSLDIRQLHAAVRKILFKDPAVKIVFIDYLQYIRSHKISSMANTHQIISEISKGLKTIAREHHISVVALSQLNREVIKQGKPTMHNLKESGSIEQDADVVMLLYRTPTGIKEPDPTAYTSFINIEIAKNRNGRTGCVQCEFYHEYTLFKDIGEINRPKFISKEEPKEEPRDGFLGNIDLGNVRETRLNNDLGNEEGLTVIEL